MRWQSRRQSDNVEDRRRMSGPAMAGDPSLMNRAFEVDEL